MSDELSTQPSYRFSIVPEWVIFEPAFNAGDVRVYAALARYGPRAFPSIGSLGVRLMVSDSSIRRSLSRLAECGAVRVEARFDGERQTSNLYVLAGDEPMGVMGDTLPPSTSDTLPPVTGDTRRKASKKESKKEQDIPSSVDDVWFEWNFEEFWKIYPRKVGKPAARKALLALHRSYGQSTAPDGGIPDACAAIATGLAKWIEYWTRERTETRFIPHPATWLNQRRWEDEPAPEKPAPEPVGRAIPQDIWGAWNEAELWTYGKRPDLRGHRIEMMHTLATLRAWGYGLGESMIRLALAVRYAPMHDLCWDPKYLADDQHRVSRFGAMPQDMTYEGETTLVECMERAYNNQRWGK